MISRFYFQNLSDALNFALLGERLWRRGPLVPAPAAQEIHEIDLSEQQLVRKKTTFCIGTEIDVSQPTEGVQSSYLGSIHN